MELKTIDLTKMYHSIRFEIIKVWHGSKPHIETIFVNLTHILFKPLFIIKNNKYVANKNCKIIFKKLKGFFLYISKQFSL